MNGRAEIVARRVLIGVGLVFLISGAIVTSMNLLGVIPSSYNWQGPLFLVLGLVGTLIAWRLLPTKRVLSLFLLAAVFIPWTIMGLIGDSKQGYWPLVAGEAVGLMVVLLSLGTFVKRAT